MKYNKEQQERCIHPNCDCDETPWGGPICKLEDNKPAPIAQQMERCKDCGKVFNPHDIVYGYHKCKPPAGQQDKQGGKRSSLHINDGTVIDLTAMSDNDAANLLFSIHKKDTEIASLQSELAEAKEDAADMADKGMSQLMRVHQLEKQITALQSSRLKDIEDAWVAGCTYGHSCHHWPIDISEPPTKASYLKQFTDKTQL